MRESSPHSSRHDMAVFVSLTFTFFLFNCGRWVFFRISGGLFVSPEVVGCSCKRARTALTRNDKTNASSLLASDHPSSLCSQNPAVSLGLAIVGAITPLRALILTVAQILGGITGSAIVSLFSPSPRRVLTPTRRPMFFASHRSKPYFLDR